jgi:hypothetical protein
VDCAEDGLTEVGETAEKPDDVPCTLRIKALLLVLDEDEMGGYGSRFVEKEEERWFCGQLDSERETFLQVDVKTPDNGVLVGPQFEEFDNLIHVRQFLGIRNRPILAEEGREFEGFADRACFIVDILLETESSPTTKLDAELFPVN